MLSTCCTNLAQGVAEEVPGALQLAAAVARHKLGQVRGPDVLGVRVLEERHAPLVRLEGVLEVLVLLRDTGRVGEKQRACVTFMSCRFISLYTPRALVYTAAMGIGCPGEPRLQAGTVPCLLLLRLVRGKPTPTGCLQMTRVGAWGMQQEVKIRNTKPMFIQQDAPHLEEQRVVEHDLGRGDAQVQDLVVHRARAFQRAQRLLQVAVEAPQLEAAVQPALQQRKAAALST